MEIVEDCFKHNGCGVCGVDAFFPSKNVYRLCSGLGYRERDVWMVNKLWLTLLVHAGCGEIEIGECIVCEGMLVKIRRLRFSDRDDVLEISRHVWEGHDYVPSVFEQWLKDKNSYFCGVEVDGRVVAFGNLHLIENKRTGWMEGLRVHPDFRGRGYANDLTRFLVRKGEELGVYRLRYTTGENNAASLKLASNAGFSRLLDKAVFWCMKPKRAPQVRGYVPIEEVKPQRAYELLESKPSLVPHGVLIFDWRAVDITLENFKEIGQTHGFFVALKRGRLGSMSFGRLRTDREKTWGFTVYASDPLGFRAHVSFNMKRALEVQADTVMCTYEKLYEGTLSQVSFGCEEQDAGHLVLLEKARTSV